MLSQEKQLVQLNEVTIVDEFIHSLSRESIMKRAEDQLVPLTDQVWVMFE